MALELIGLEAVIEGVSSYLSNANAVSDATEDIGASTEGAADQSSLLGDILGGVGTAAMVGFAAAAAAAAAAIVGFTAYMTGAVGAAMEAEESQARLDIVLRATGGAAGVTSEMATDLATSLSQVTRFSDDTIIAAESVLLRFQGIGEETFPQATKATLDLAATLGIDASAAAFQLGRALEAPGEGLRVLTRAGVILTDQEKEMIEAMVTAGDTAGAQAFILDKLSSSIGGAAEAMGQTFAGQVDILKNRLGEVQEAIGMALLPVLRDLLERYILPLIPQVERLGVVFADWITGTAIPAFQQFLPILEQFGQQILQWIVNTAIPALQAFSDWFMNVALPAIIPVAQAILSQLIPGLQQLAVWMGDLATAVMPVLSAAIGFVVENWEIFAAIGAAVIAVVVAINAPILAVIAVVVLLATAWANNWGDIQGKTEAVWGVIEPLITRAIEAVRSAIETALEFINDFWADHGEQITSIAQDTWTRIQNFIQSALTFISNTVTTILDSVRSFWEAHGESIGTIAEFWWNNIQTTITVILGLIALVIANVVNAIQVVWENWGSTILAVAENTWNAIQGVIEGVTQIIGGIIDAFAAAIEGDWSEFGAALEDIWQGVWDTITAILSGAWANISAIIANLISLIIGLFTNTDWGSVGRSIIDGIKSGITNAAAGLAQAAANAAAAALDAAKGFLGIDSPSKAFEEVGENIGEGLVAGMESLQPAVAFAAQELAQTAMSSFGASFVEDADTYLPSDWLGQEAITPGSPSIMPGVDPFAVGLDALEHLLTTGDFSGAGLFGLQEDDPFVYAALQLSETLSQGIPGIMPGVDALAVGMDKIGDVLTSGDFESGIFGLEEDDPFMLALYDLSAALRATGYITPLAPVTTAAPETRTVPVQTTVPVGPNYISSPMTMALFQSMLSQAIREAG